jgi:hypothetical protein
MGAAYFPRLGGRRGGMGRRPPRAAKLSAVPPRPDTSPGPVAHGYQAMAAALVIRFVANALGGQGVR